MPKAKTTKAKPEKRKFSKIKKAAKAKTAKSPKRGNYKTSVKPECPRCGEKVSIVLEKTSTAGVKYYRCFSEECKKNSVRPGRGRGFVVPPGRANCKK